ncbi:Tho complex subunit 7-domain-containing protein [Corynascus novoguineensis]|uniref:Tho complex subunit 7-domain-containing protein n=1 Tax=Corynascus novoguineensis TaxID=1126955 RepID=A0AAN7D0T5_9PEZI|nr:Tho complex subunit 7-domain-containing protein [Corynascus novoguineensis]
MASWGLLDDKEENELHKSRLLNVEEKPFKRITKRLNTLHSLTSARARQAPTPPPESNGASQQQHHDDTPAPGSSEDASLDLPQLREDITIDFAAFDSSIARLQFLLTANERERERYAAERGRIVAASQAVRESTTRLRVELEQARATLAQRREFDALADAITANASLRPRAEQAANLRKLRDEIAELEAEREAYGVTWHERREQFARIMDESMRLRRLIRDEKEEVERREGMDDDGEAGATPRPSGTGSREGTPKLDGGLAPKSGMVGEGGDGEGTSRPVSVGGRTPVRDSPAPGQDAHSFTAKRATATDASFSQVGSQVGSQMGSQIGSRPGSREGSVEREAQGSVEREAQGSVEEGEDVEMREAKDNASEPNSPLSPPPADDTPQIVVDGEGESMDTT